LLEAIDAGFAGVRNVGPAGIQSISEAISSLSGAIDNGDEVNWLKYCAKQGIRILPASYRQGSSTETITKTLSKTIPEVLRYDADDRRWRIVQRRFGLDNTEKLTLDELGTAYGLTRERVRQIEKSALDELRDVLLENNYSGKSYHVHPDVGIFVRAVFLDVAALAKDFVLETELLDIAQRKAGADSEPYAPVLALLFELFGMGRIHLDNPDLVPVWEFMETKHRAMAEEAISLIDAVLSREKPIPMDEFDLLFIVNSKLPKSKHLTVLQLLKFTELCSSAERTSDGLVQSRFEHIKGRSNQVARILWEANTPLHKKDVVREMNKRLIAAGKTKVSLATLTNHTMRDERFVAFGRSGHWGLANWEHATSSTITELMEESLIALNRPATVEEIYSYVAVRRPASVSSIKIYLAAGGNFRKADRTRWGLSTWKETRDALTWRPEQVAAFVEDLFRKLRSNEVEFTILRQALMEAANVTSQQARGMLGVNPVITTRREAKPLKIYAVFVPDYKRNWASNRLRVGRNKETMLQKTERTVKNVLSAEPNNLMELSRLASILERKHGFVKRAAYGYISKMAFLEKIDLPGSSRRICRLKAGQTGTFPQTTKINSLDPNKATQASRALENLNVHNVDIGLFMLGRLFEDTLRDYMVFAEKVRAYPVSPNNYSKLNNMIDWVKSQNIISDSSALHFLRQERNARAHNSPPSLGERQVLLNSATWVASMYLDYIVFVIVYRVGRRPGAGRKQKSTGCLGSYI
jgi:hypothetical protein